MQNKDEMFKTIGLIAIILVEYIKCDSHVCNQSVLSTTVPPGTNFDLTHWELDLPTANESVELKPDVLVNGYQSQWFYTSPIDGSMTFYVPGNGGTTPHSEFPRSELRHMCNPKTNDDNWLIGNGVHELYAKIRVDQNISTPEMIVAQIHGYICM